MMAALGDQVEEGEALEPLVTGLAASTLYLQQVPGSWKHLIWSFYLSRPNGFYRNHGMVLFLI